MDNNNHHHNNNDNNVFASPAAAWITANPLTITSHILM